MILDTNALSALFIGDPALEVLLSSEDIHHLPVIVIGEYRYGIMRSRHRTRLERLLDLLIDQSLVLPIEETTTKHYAAVRDELRRSGKPIPENDVWVAALARQHEMAIVTRDLHFDAIDRSLRRSW